MAERGSNIQTFRTAGSCFPRSFGGFFLLLHVRPWLEMNDSYFQCLKICRKKGTTLTRIYRSLSHHRVNGLRSRATGGVGTQRGFLLKAWRIGHDERYYY